MKILVLYTARSGTNNICDYFLRQNPNYKFFNQPFTLYQEDGIIKVPYKECIKYDNVLVKSEISYFYDLHVSKEQVLLEFDKVLLLSRKNKREQAISYIIASTAKNFLDKNKRGYYVEGIDKDILDEIKELQAKQHDKLLSFVDNSFRFFYYEDLYYGDFSELFKYLDIKFIQTDFDDILSISNRYRHKDLPSKAVKTLT
jgi:hypothetical protein